MTVNKKDILEFEEMFNLSAGKDDGRDGENEQAEEYGHSTESLEPFKKLVEEVSEGIDKNEDKGSSLIKENPHNIVKDICSGEASSIAASEKNISDDFFDDLPVKDDLSVEEDKKETSNDLFIKEIEDEIEEEVDVRKKEIEKKIIEEEIYSISNVAQVGSGNDQIEWMLDSPSAMYNSFYVKKRDLLFKYMVGGTIEYKRWTKELEEAKVIIKGEVFDHQLIINQMEEVQQYRERVKFIQIRVNNQYFTFKRFIDMMRGFLARIEYLKPVIRQEGLIMEHMRDIELYYARLEALHDSATKTEKVLASAFDTLSRKCTICMELKPSERIEKADKEILPISHNLPSLREHSEEFDKFDDLPNHAAVVPQDYKVGKISWNEI